MAVEKGKRIVDQNSATAINNDDVLVIDSETRGTRKIKYGDLCSAVAATLGIADIKSTADGAMAKSVYDSDDDGVVDNAKKVDGHTVEKDLPADAKLTDTVYDDTAVKKSVADEVARAKKAEQANTDALALKMTTKTYDADGDGVVDNAAKVNSHSVESDVPAGAVFTDTVYDDSAVKKSITDETVRAKKAEEANTQLTNDLKTGLTSGTVKVAKATSADSASSLGKVSTYQIGIPDNGGRRKYLLMYDITDWITAKSNAATRAFDGYFFSRRSGGYVGTNYTGNLSIVASYNGVNSDGSAIKSDNGISLRLRTTSSTYVPRILHQKSNDKYYLSLMTGGSGRDLILFGIFQGTFIGTWINNEGANLSNGTLPSDYEEYSEGFYSIPYEKAVCDKNGKDITEYLAAASYADGAFTLTRGNGGKTVLTIPDASATAKGLLTTSDKALVDRIAKINLTDTRSVSNVSWAIDSATLNQDLSKLLPGKYKLSAKFKIETDQSSGLTCANPAWSNLISVYVGATTINVDTPKVSIPIGTAVGYEMTNYCTFTISEANAHATNFHAYFYLAGDGTSNRPYIGSVSNIELTMVN